MVSDILAGDGKIANLFYSVCSPRQVLILPHEIFSSSCLDESDVELGEAVAEEERPEVVLLEQELQHVQARLLVAPVYTRPSNA